MLRTEAAEVAEKLSFLGLGRKRGGAMEEEAMDIRQLAEYTGLAEETIQRFIHTNQIPFIKTAEGYRFKKRVIDMWLAVLDCNFYINLHGAGLIPDEGRSRIPFFEQRRGE